LLLEENWRDLFILTAIEQQFTINNNDFIYLNEIYKSDIEHFQEILYKFKQIKIDSNEFICLKSFVLFNCQTMINSQLNDFHTIHYLHSQAQILLNTYINKQYSTEPNRFIKFITLISSFRFIPPLTIEEIFFRKTIGDKTHMKQLVKDMYKMVVNS
jgi:nuclear receptor subfamily 2 group E protein 1